MLSYRLRHRVEIQQLVEAGRDPGTGGVISEWQTLVVAGKPMNQVPAEVLTGPGSERQAAGAVQAETDARINLRWFPGLTQKMRILWDGRIYNIDGLATDRTGRQEWRTTCKEGVNDG
jgi:SPP1 family predicted phage head-tail adaptor